MREFARKHLLDHERRLAEDADTRGNVREENDPEQPKLRCRHGLCDEHVACRDHLLAVRSLGYVAGRGPALGWDANDERADHHEGEIDHAHREHRRRHAVKRRRRVVLDECDGERGADERSAAEAHDCRSRRETRAIGEPLDERRDRRDIPDPEPHATDDAVAQEHEREKMQRHARAGDEETTAKEQGCCEHRFARTDAFDPFATKRGSEAEKDDRETEDPADIGNFPIARNRIRDPDEHRHRFAKNAEGVRLTDGKVDAQRGRRDEPAAKPRFCDRMRPV